MLGGPAPVRRFLPDLIRLIEDRVTDQGKVFDLTLPLDLAAGPGVQPGVPRTPAARARASESISLV